MIYMIIGVPDGLNYVLISFLVGLFILFYLLRISEFFNWQKFRLSLGGLILLAFVWFGYLLFKQHKYEDKPRLAIFPIQYVSEQLPEKKWIAVGVTELIQKAIPTSGTVPYYVYRQTHLRDILVVDSLTQVAYLERISRDLKLDFFLWGLLVSRHDSLVFNYRIHTTQTNKSYGVTNRFSDFEQVPEISRNAANMLLEYAFPNQKLALQPYPNFSERSLAWYAQACAKLNAKQAKLGILLLEQALAEDSTNQWAWTRLGQALFELKIGEQSNDRLSTQQPLLPAYRCLERAYFLDSTDVEVTLQIAQYHVITKRWNLAEKMLKRAYKIDSTDPDLYLMLSRLHPYRFQSLGFETEKELLEYALFLNTAFVDGRLALARYYIKFEQDYQAAIRVLEPVLKIDPNQVDILMELGRLYFTTHAPKKVFETYTRLVQLVPENSHVFYNLGIYYFNLKDFENSIKLFERAIQIDQHLDAHLYAAFIYEQLGTQETDDTKRKALLERAINYLRYRFKYRKEKDDPYAETARVRLYNIFHNPDYETIIDSVK